MENEQTLLTPNYLANYPDLILLNSHGLKSNDFLNNPGYRVHKINYSESPSDGSAIAIKYNINYKLYDDFDNDFIAIETDTSQVFTCLLDTHSYYILICTDCLVITFQHISLVISMADILFLEKKG